MNLTSEDEEAVAKVMQFADDKECTDDHTMAGFIIRILDGMYPYMNIRKTSGSYERPVVDFDGIRVKKGKLTINVSDAYYLVDGFRRKDFKTNISRFFSRLRTTHVHGSFRDRYTPRSPAAPMVHVPRIKEIGPLWDSNINTYINNLLGPDSEIECKLPQLCMKKDYTLTVYVSEFNEDSIEEFVDAALQLHAFLIPLPDAKVAIQ